MSSTRNLFVLPVKLTGNQFTSRTVRALCFIVFVPIVIALCVCNPAALSKPSKSSGSSIKAGGKTIPMERSYVEQLDSLRKIGVAIYYPSFVPPRFSSVTVTLTDAEADKKHFDYSIEFCDRKEHCFSIESAYSGIGDGPDGDRVLKGTSKIFGNFRIDVFKPFSEGNNTKDIYYLGSWMKDKKAADAEKKGTWTNDARHYHFLGTGITDQEAQKIVTSLVPVTNCRTK